MGCSRGSQQQLRPRDACTTVVVLEGAAVACLPVQPLLLLGLELTAPLRVGRRQEQQGGRDRRTVPPSSSSLLMLLLPPLPQQRRDDVHGRPPLLLRLCEPRRHLARGGEKGSTDVSGAPPQRHRQLQPRTSSTRARSEAPCSCSCGEEALLPPPSRDSGGDTEEGAAGAPAA